MAAGPAERAPASGRVGRRFALVLVAIFFVALGVRVAAAVVLPDGSDCAGCSIGWPIGPTEMGGYPRVPGAHVGGDGHFYVLASDAFAEGKGYVNPVRGTPYAQQPPLWTASLGAADASGLESVLSKKLLFAVLGAGTAVLVALAAREVASPRAGAVAGGIAALYPGFWMYERNLNAETVVLPLVATVLLLAYRYRRRPSWLVAVALGVAVGALILARSEQVLIVPFLLAPLLLSTPGLSWQSRGVRLGAACLLILALQAPWTIYNLGRFDKPVILSSGSGYTALAGACDETFYGDRLGSFSSGTCILRDPAALIEDATRGDAALRSSALDYTSANLGRLPVVIAAREGRSFGLFAPGQQVTFNSQLLNAPSWTLWVWYVLYWLLLPLAVVGCLLLRRRRVVVYPLLAFPLVVLVSTAMTFGDVRYRTPADVSLVVLAAVALATPWREWRGRAVRGTTESSDRPRSTPVSSYSEGTAARAEAQRGATASEVVLPVGPGDRGSPGRAGPDP